MAIRLVRALRARYNKISRKLSQEAAHSGRAHSVAEPLGDRRLLSVNILTPVQHAAEGNRVGFFADYAAAQRPASTRVRWGDGTIEDLMLDYDGATHSGTAYGVQDYAAPAVYS